MKEIVNEQLRKGNLIAFPRENKDIIAVLNREDRTNKFIQIYDVRRQSFIRRISKENMENESFTIDLTGKLLAISEKNLLYIKLVRIPNSPELADVLRPRYNQAKMKTNPAVASENRQITKDNFYSMLHNYHLFKDNPEHAERVLKMTEEDNVQMMVYKYDKIRKEPFKIKENRELMMLQKVLLRDSFKS